MAVLIGVLLAVLVVGVVVYPFLRAGLRLPTPPSRGPSADSGRDRPEAILEEIKTLQLEHELGTVNDGEYHERLAVYRLQAAAALRDREQSGEDLDLSVEKEIMEARALLGDPKEEAHDGPYSGVGEGPAQ